MCACLLPAARTAGGTARASRAPVRCLVPALLSLAACAVAPDAEVSDAEAPLIGVDGHVDSADRACNVVLREVSRPPNGTGGWQTNGTSWIWNGTIDVNPEAVLEGSEPRVLYHYGSSPTWWQVAATAVDGAPAGFARFAFTLDHDLPGPGMSGTALANARVEVVPFLALSEGGRLFDHNRNPGDFDNYILNLGNGFSVGASAACPAHAEPPPARLVFATDWSELVVGELRAGGKARIEYDLARLATCRGTTHGFPLWDLVAHLRWSTGAEEAHSVRDGAPTVAVPAGATWVELWFHNTGVSGCEGWDSDYGANYRFAVAP
jgi:hypothetical protein